LRLGQADLRGFRPDVPAGAEGQVNAIEPGALRGLARPGDGQVGEVIGEEDELHGACPSRVGPRPGSVVRRRLAQATDSIDCPPFRSLRSIGNASLPALKALDPRSLAGQSASIAAATRLAERVTASMPQGRLSANEPAKGTRPT